MSSGIPLSNSPPPMAQNTAATGSLRRHHTISSSRPPRRNTVISEEPHEWDDDEFVGDEEWTGPQVGSPPVGVVGEPKVLHRQASLPSGYNRELRHVRSQANTRMNSLSAIEAEHGAEEEAEAADWEQHIPWNHQNVDEIPSQHPAPPTVQRPPINRTRTTSQSSSPLSPMFSPPVAPSPPTGTTVRRHQSLTYGATQPGAKLARTATGGKRIGRGGGDLALGVAVPRTASPVNDEYDEEYEEEEPTKSRSSSVAEAIWADNRGGYGNGAYPNRPQWQQNDDTMDEIQRALGALDIQNSITAPYILNNQPQRPYQPGRVVSSHPPPPPKNSNPPVSQTPPRFAASPAPSATGSTRGSTPLSFNTYAQQQQQDLQLVTEVGKPTGPLSASGYIPTVGAHMSAAADNNYGTNNNARNAVNSRANSLPHWDQQQKQQAQNGRIARPEAGGYSNVQQQQQPGPYAYEQMYNNGYPDQATMMSNLAVMNGLTSPQLLGMNLNQGFGSPFGAFGNNIGNGSLNTATMGGGPAGRLAMNTAPQAGGPADNAPSPVDIQSLIAAKGYNPTTFDTRPVDARFFVIKSYTEDDVHKSLKYEIWSSTDPGNKRLDKAFRENGGRGPIYLFFSVNGSGHFCGMAEMLTPVDYTRSSTVWAQDKWKGVFKVRWIFVRDIPNAVLRGIRLENTQERKPVTNSRDTQELLPDAGGEMLRIFLTQQARTSLLQDFDFYELQAAQKAVSDEQQGPGGQQQQQPGQQPPPPPPPRKAQPPAYGVPAAMTPQQMAYIQIQQQQQQQQAAAQAQYGVPGAGRGVPQQQGRPFVQRSPSYPASNASGGY